MKKHIHGSILVSLLTVALLLSAVPMLATSGADAQPLTWTIRTMDRRQVIESSMGVDANGDLHATGFDYTGASLLYATNSAPYGNWSDTKVDDMTGYFASQQSSVLDSAGRVHIGYYDGFTKQLKYANNLDGWTTELVHVNPGSEDVGVGIAVDSASKAHMSYVIDEALKYATNSGGAWTNSTLVDEEHVIHPTNIAIGSDDVVHIVYRTYHYFELNSTVLYWVNHTWYAGGTWNFETITSFQVLVTAGIVHTLGALAVDGLGRPQFVYSIREYLLPYNPRLVHVVKDGAWSAPYVFAYTESNPAKPFFTIATDSANQAHVAWGDSQGLMYSTSVGGWSTATVVAGINVNNVRPGIALGPSGDVYIAFLDPGASFGDFRWSYVTTAALPSEPWDLALAPSPGSLQVQWRAPNSTGSHPLVGYTVNLLNVNPAFGGEPVLSIGVSAATTSYTFTGLAGGGEYWVFVTAASSAGHSDRSSVLTATIADLPTAPYMVTAVGYSDSVMLSWYPPLYSNYSLVQNYSIAWGLSEAAMGSEVVLGNVNTFTHTNLLAGQTYFYKVRARNSMGWGPYSSVAQATVQGSPPTAPLNLAAVAGDGWVRLTWQAPTSASTTPIASYQVFRGNVAGDLGTVAFASVGGSMLTLNDTSVSNGVTYYYAVRATNDFGTGDFSSVADALPQGSDAPDDGGGGIDMMVIAIVAIAAIAAIAVAAFFLMRRGR